MMSVPNMKQFFDLAQERERVRLARLDGHEAPWTADKILQHFRFCNVHRIDDRLTEWYVENIAKPLAGDPRLLIATCATRWFNKIETLELLKPSLLGNQDTGKMRDALLPVVKMGAPIFGSAYIIQSPTGMSKLDGILWSLRNVAAKWEEGVQIASETKHMEAVHAWLQQFPHLGPFMAYQVVCDLSYGYLLEGAVDRDTWTCAGPGAARGMSWLLHDEPDIFNYNSQRDQGLMIANMRDVLDCSRSNRYWPTEWRPWELATVQHWSCEYDKWRRGWDGQNLKRRYNP